MDSASRQTDAYGNRFEFHELCAAPEYACCHIHLHGWTYVGLKTYFCDGWYSQEALSFVSEWPGDRTMSENRLSSASPDVNACQLFQPSLASARSSSHKRYPSDYGLSCLCANQ